EVARAGEEPGTLELAPVGAAEGTQEVLLLAGVVQPRHERSAMSCEEPRQVPVAAHRNDGDTFGAEAAAAATRERLDGAPVARALDEHDRARIDPCHSIVLAASS